MNDGMPSLAQTIETFHGFLRGSISLEAATRELGASPSRLAAYHRFVRSHIDQTLRKNYAAVCTIVGEAVWCELVERYFQRYPARDYELNANTAAFCEFLAELSEGGALGISKFTAQLALLEWNEFVAFAAEDTSAEGSPGQLRINPTLTVLDFDYPVATYLDAFRAAQENGAPLPHIEEIERSERVLVFRHPQSHLAAYYVATDDLLFALKLVYEQVSCAAAADAAGVPVKKVEEYLAHALDLGLVVAPGSRVALGQ